MNLTTHARALLALCRSSHSTGEFSGVRRNAVSPEPTRAEGTESTSEGLAQLAAGAPAGRPAKADELAEAVFLATDRTSFIQDAKLAVDGGRTAI
jgi:NAD(P)-dependent dehydrogenase (short-subunit alcohol dehydrogenase family)